MIGTQTVSPTELRLKRLYIKPELKGRGIGSKLLAKVEDFAREKGVTTIYTRFAKYYHEAAVFYPSRGFEKTHSEEDYVYCMLKRLI